MNFDKILQSLVDDKINQNLNNSLSNHKDNKLINSFYYNDLDNLSNESDKESDKKELDKDPDKESNKILDNEFDKQELDKEDSDKEDSDKESTDEESLKESDKESDEGSNKESELEKSIEKINHDIIEINEFYNADNQENNYEITNDNINSSYENKVIKSMFDYIPDILKPRKITPSYCGYPIKTYKRYISLLCNQPGCIRCHTEKLLKNGYSKDIINSLRKPFIKIEL